jgi:membrane fusion protein (multidrug efflux system)
MPTDERKGATVIRQRAVNELQGLTQVAVVGDDDIVKWRTVKMGPRTGSDWIVESGLEPGETIVVEGLQKIRDGMKVAPTPWQPPSPAKEAAAQPAAGK